jgi:hypothetical protein
MATDYGIRAGAVLHRISIVAAQVGITTRLRWLGSESPPRSMATMTAKPECCGAPTTYGIAGVGLEALPTIKTSLQACPLYRHSSSSASICGGAQTGVPVLFCLETLPN